MNHWYDPEEGKLYFHGAKTGHKIDAIAKCDKVSYCVYNAGYKKEGEWALNVTSVVVFGRISPLDDEKKAQIIGEHLIRKFTDDEEYIRREIEGHAARTLMFALVPEHITGKIVNEA